MRHAYKTGMLHCKLTKSEITDSNKNTKTVHERKVKNRDGKMNKNDSIQELSLIHV